MTATCAAAEEHGGRIGTPEDRRALVEYLVDKTLAREAFSDIKNDTLSLDVEAEMRAHAADVIAAGSDTELFYALAKLSNARRDRHLALSGIPGGIHVPPFYTDGGDDLPHAGVRIAADFAGDAGHFFVLDVAADDELSGGVEPGDRIVSVNGISILERLQISRAYIAYSTEAGFRSRFARVLPSKSALLPPDHYDDALHLVVERSDGQLTEARLDYVDSDSIAWRSDSRRKYPQFSLVARRNTFDLYRPFDETPVLLLSWHHFRENIYDDMDWLMTYAADNGLLDHDIIWDGTASAGGGEAPYVVRRLTPNSFRTTFSNLRLSDITQEFVEQEAEARRNSSPSRRSLRDDLVHDPAWTVDWLSGQVLESLADGMAYTANVPFRLEYGPAQGDGTVEPAEVHFRGRIVCLTGPEGGSRLDQFVAIVVDNALCHTIGMPTGGFSNSWEWDEAVVFPTTGEPVVGFTWSIGHTIRPNGEVLEGNPAAVHDFIPLTRDNFRSYGELLIDRALSHLGYE